MRPFYRNMPFLSIADLQKWLLRCEGRDSHPHDRFFEAPSQHPRYIVVGGVKGVASNPPNNSPIN